MQKIVSYLRAAAILRKIIKYFTRIKTSRQIFICLFHDFKYKKDVLHFPESIFLREFDGQFL